MCDYGDIQASHIVDSSPLTKLHSCCWLADIIWHLDAYDGNNSCVMWHYLLLICWTCFMNFKYIPEERAGEFVVTIYNLLSC